MKSDGFDVKIHCDLEKTGFCFGGNKDIKGRGGLMFVSYGSVADAVKTYSALKNNGNMLHGHYVGFF